MAMALPQLPQIPPIFAMTWPQTNCNKKKNFPSYFGNAIAINPFHNFFFFFRNDMCTQFLQYFYNKF